MKLHKRCILSIVKCIWQIYISNEVIEYQDLYRNKDHIRKNKLRKQYVL